MAQTVCPSAFINRSNGLWSTKEMISEILSELRYAAQ